MLEVERDNGRNNITMLDFGKSDDFVVVDVERGEGKHFEEYLGDEREAIYPEAEHLEFCQERKLAGDIGNVVSDNDQRA